MHIHTSLTYPSPKNSCLPVSLYRNVVYIAKPPRSQVDWAQSHRDRGAGDTFSEQYSPGFRHRDKYSAMPGPPGLHASL